MASLKSYQDESQKAKRSSLVKAILAESEYPTPENPKPELMSVYILMQTIRSQEEALNMYLDAVAGIVDPDLR